MRKPPFEGKQSPCVQAAAGCRIGSLPTHRGSSSVAITSFKGNKQSLPSKPCRQCGRAMTWRRAWAKNWAEVKYCSDRCRTAAKSSPAGAPP